MFAIEDAKRVQADLQLRDKHVVWVDPVQDGWFVIAHTDAERAVAHMISLRECTVHAWLESSAAAGGLNCGCFPQAGWYIVDGFHHARGLAL